MFEGFETYCIEQVFQDSSVSREDLHPLTSEQIATLGRNLGFTAIPEAIWASPNDEWMVIDMYLDEPRNCVVSSTLTPLDINVAEWNSRIVNTDGFRSQGAVEVHKNRAGGWATKPVDGDFVQLSLSNMELSADPFASLSILTAIRVGKTPASCEFFPEECE